MNILIGMVFNIFIGRFYEKSGNYLCIGSSWKYGKSSYGNGARHAGNAV